MKFVVSILSIVLFFTSCIDRGAKRKVHAAKPYLKFFNDSTEKFGTTSDEKLIDFWVDFKEALLKKDISKLKTLSTDCIDCYHCDTARYIPVEKFYSTYFDKVFDHTFLNRMNDTSKVVAHYDDANWQIYTKECIFKSADFKKTRIAEIMVSVTDQGSFYKGFQGQQAAVAFIDTPKGYKFCAYSTIP